MKRALSVILSVLLASLLFVPSAITVQAAGTQIYVASTANSIDKTGFFRYDADTGSLTEKQSGEDWNIAYDETANLVTLRDLIIKDTDLFVKEVIFGEEEIDPAAVTAKAKQINEVLYAGIGLRIITSAPLTIDLEGSSSISLSNPEGNGMIASVVTGLSIEGSKVPITIQGGGSLDAHCISNNQNTGYYPFVSASGIRENAGEIDMTSGTLNLDAEGTYTGIGFCAFGTSEDRQYSLKVSGGSLTSRGVGYVVENSSLIESYIFGVGTGISASRAVSISNGSVNVSAQGAGKAFGFNLYTGIEMSGGDVVIDAGSRAVNAVDDPLAINAIHANAVPIPFDPALSIISPMSILEARDENGAAIANPVAFDFYDGVRTRYVIGPIDGAGGDMASYAHIGTAAPAPTPASSASAETASSGSGWVQSYEIRFLDCLGRMISDQWVAEGQPASIPEGYTYQEEELSWVYRNLTVSPSSCRYSGYIVPNTADRG